MLTGVGEDSRAKDRIQDGDSKTKKASKPSVKDSQFSKLESLHERMGVEGSLGLSGGRRLKLSDGRPPQKVKIADGPDFNFEFTEVGGRSPRDRESSEEMPDVDRVLADMDQQKLPVKPEGRSSEGYSDSEMDALMLAIDSNGVLDDSIHPIFAQETHTNDNRHMPTDAAAKRKLARSLSKSSSPHSESPESPAKKVRLSSDPLFIRNSLPSSSPAFTLGDAVSQTKNNDTKSIGREIEDYFALDEDIFKIAPGPDSRGLDLATASSPTAASAETDVHTDKSCASQKEDRAKPGDAMEDQGQDNAYDFLADLDDWIENSGCIRIVDSLE